MCFVFVWEQTATCATYSINWLVFISEMKSVYSAVRTGSLHKILRSAHTVFVFCIYLRTNSDWCHLQHKLIGFYIRDEKCLLRSTDWVLTYNSMFCPHCIYVFCIYLRTNSDLCHLQHKLIGFYIRDERCLLRSTDWVLTYNSTFCPHCIYVFCVDLRTNSDLCHLQHKLTGFYIRDERCLQRGTEWVFK